MACSPRGSSVHGDSPGRNAGAGCHSLLQGIFPIQGLPALQVDLLLSELPRKPHLHQGYYFIPGIAVTGSLGKRALQAREKVTVIAARSSPSLCDPMDCSPPGPSVRGDSPGKTTGGGCLCFSRASNPGLSRRRLLQRILRQQRHLLG